MFEVSFVIWVRLCLRLSVMILGVCVCVWFFCQEFQSPLRAVYGVSFVWFRRRWVAKGMSLKDKVDDGEGLRVFRFSFSCQSTITGF